MGSTAVDGIFPAVMRCAYKVSRTPAYTSFTAMVLTVAAFMTAVSGWSYLKAGIVTIRKLDKGKKA